MQIYWRHRIQRIGILTLGILLVGGTLFSFATTTGSEGDH